MLCDIFIFVILRLIGTSFILMTHFCTTHWIDGPEVEVGRKIRMQLIELVIFKVRVIGVHMYSIENLLVHMIKLIDEFSVEVTLEFFCKGRILVHISVPSENQAKVFLVLLRKVL